MQGIFISYRRDDSEGQAGRLFDDLVAHYGRGAVFMDVANIKKGFDFRRSIEEQVASCGVLLVMIGKHWLGALDAAGQPRLADANDFVRLETAAALARDIPVVPVLVQGASMPREQDLPDALKPLAFRNGTELTHARWESDVTALIADLTAYVEAPVAPPKPGADADRAHADRAAGGGKRRSWLIGLAVAVVVATGLFGVALSRSPSIVVEPRQPLAQMMQAAADNRTTTTPAAAPTPTVMTGAPMAHAAREAPCRPGFVWRLATSADRVCVPPQSRQQALADNAQAGSRRSPAGGEFGPATCRAGFVWREASPGDTVCVTADVRRSSAADNALAASRSAPVGAASR